MKHLTLSCGFETDVDETIFDDMELFDAIMNFQRGDRLSISMITDRILGSQKAALYDLLRTETGRVPVEAVMNAVTELLLEAAPKNS